jgi:hypothetical protein
LPIKTRFQCLFRLLEMEMKEGLKLGAGKRTETLPVEGEHDLVESGQMK